MWLICLLLFFLPAVSLYAEYDLAVCAIFQDEAPYLKEWIEFHKLMGVQHFYLYNHASRDDYQKVLAPYLEEVELFDWPFPHQNMAEWNEIQCQAYRDAVKRAKGKVKWLAFLDVDEFLFPTREDNLVAFLADFEEFGEVSANWQMFGTSDVPKIPPGKLLIETLVLKAPENFIENRHVKSIVRPECVTGLECPHFCFLMQGFRQVTAQKVPFIGHMTPRVDVSQLRINHYWTRDEHFFHSIKLPRRQAWQESWEVSMRRLLHLNQERDETILRFAKALRKRIFLEKR